MTVTPRTAIRGFGGRWILLSALGLASGLAVALGVAEPLEALVGMTLVTPVMLGLAGSVFGASQWLAIGKWRRAAVGWIAASAVALGIGMTLGIVMVELLGRAITGEQPRLVDIGPVGRLLGLLAIGVVTGAAVGSAQYLALRPRIPASWVVRTAVAFGVGLPGGGLTADLLLGGLQGPAGFATFLGMSGLIVGIITVRLAARVQRAV